MPYNGIWLMTKKIKSVSWPLVSSSPIESASPRIVYPCPHHLLVKRHFALWGCHLREDRREGFNQVEKPYCESVSLCDFSEFCAATNVQEYLSHQARDLQPLILTKEDQECPVTEYGEKEVL